jgi:hypothetical protein
VRKSLLQIGTRALDRHDPRSGGTRDRRIVLQARPLLVTAAEEMGSLKLVHTRVRKNGDNIAVVA